MIIPMTHLSYAAVSARNSNASTVSASAINESDANNERASTALDAAIHSAVISTISIILALMNELDRKESLTVAAKYPAISKNALTHAKWNQIASAFWLVTYAISSLASVASIYIYLKDNQESKVNTKNTEREPLLPTHINIK